MKKSKPFITIITPNYNGEKYLLNTLNSVFNQTDKNFEFILLDGKSTDNSINIIIGRII